MLFSSCCQDVCYSKKVQESQMPSLLEGTGVEDLKTKTVCEFSLRCWWLNNTVDDLTQI